MSLPSDELRPREVLSMFLEELTGGARQLAHKLGFHRSGSSPETSSLSPEDIAHYRAMLGTPAAQDKLLELILQASQDGVITAEEMAYIEAVQEVVGVGASEMSALKLAVLQNLVGQLLLAGVVRAEDLQLLRELTRGLALRDEDRPALETMFGRLAQVHKIE